MNNYCKIIFVAFVFFILYSLFFIPQIEAAILYLEPEESEYYQEDVFVVQVKLDTEQERINAVKVELNFPPEILEVIDVSRGDSIFSLWPEEPLFSNEKGIIFFIGGIPLGFEGQGRLISIPFQVISRESLVDLAKISFGDSSQVLLNDGLGTSAKLTALEAIFTIYPEKAEFPKDEWQQELIKDDVPPEPFEIIIKQDPLIFDGKYFIAFYTTDLGSGIDYYQVKEGDRPWKRAKSPYLLEDQALQGLIKVRAVDKAGNERVAELMPPILPEPLYKSFFLLGSVILAIILLLAYILKKNFWRKKS